MDRSCSGGLSWADQWDYNTPDPPPPPPENDKKGKDGSKAPHARLKKWIKELCQKKPHK
ncbi:hypothetical protein IHE45_05G023100 [Dioscorea alata]|uniref:Uncharacterized protein n=1 Tax=Dioscorea alata TaxID=55571 RepID=A0ACB7VZN7_DIOAL|nr:hypothetical protein IHE45_05G023100 [Dioscorea alata]